MKKDLLAQKQVTLTGTEYSYATVKIVVSIDNLRQNTNIDRVIEELDKQYDEIREELQGVQRAPSYPAP